ncbi:MAG: hypothetical protein WAO83_09005 [Fuerstiella sp.]
MLLVLFAARPICADDLAAAAKIEGDSQLEVSVGMSGFVKQVVFSGSELTVREVDPRRSPIAVRIDEVYPHGDDFRYDLTFFGLEPGTHNLTEYLARKDAGSVEDLPPILITVKSILPADQFAPSTPEVGLVARIGGYYMVMILAIIVWVAGLLAILFWGRRKSEAIAGTAKVEVSEVDQIRMLVDRAMQSGELSAEQKADLDMRVLNFWRSRRDLSGLAVADSLVALKHDEQAGPLLQGLEKWFYGRSAPNRDQIVALLNPMSELVAREIRSPAKSAADASNSTTALPHGEAS